MGGGKWFLHIIWISEQNSDHRLETIINRPLDDGFGGFDVVGGPGKHFALLSFVLHWLSSPHREMQACDAICFCNPRCESRDCRALDGTTISDLCSAVCIAENVAMHFHCDFRSRCGNPLRCRPWCKHHCERDAAMWWTESYRLRDEDVTMTVLVVSAVLVMTATPLELDLGKSNLRTGASWGGIMSNIFGPLWSYDFLEKQAICLFVPVIFGAQKFQRGPGTGIEDRQLLRSLCFRPPLRSTPHTLWTGDNVFSGSPLTKWWNLAKCTVKTPESQRILLSGPEKGVFWERFFFFLLFFSEKCIF